MDYMCAIEQHVVHIIALDMQKYSIHLHQIN